MSVFSWLKGLFVEDINPEDVQAMLGEEQPQELVKDYKVKIFEVNNKNELNQVNSFIAQDKSMALIKMHKFTGDHVQLKETLTELKQACDSCNSRILGVSNNMFLVVKNSVEVLKE